MSIGEVKREQEVAKEGKTIKILATATFGAKLFKGEKLCWSKFRPSGWSPKEEKVKRRLKVSCRMTSV